ncbi:MAG TPA: discoidin domain-containing protein [Sedimentisphaerales bacterium]|nr:discoidin domain-containing protein [Sedimentisphaerales bacterium]
MALDTVLQWTSPRFAKTHDMYFGTSFVDVNSASRDNPRDVLVSEGQAETLYDPEGLLEFGRTYCWRVDYVGAGPAFTVYRGPVLDFTTEAVAYPITNIIATASSSQPGVGPENTVNGSGLDNYDGHSTHVKDMWQSGTVGPHWIEFEFDKVYALHELWVWNSNQVIEPIIGFGAKSVEIEYSTDGMTWTPLDEVPEFARAPGQAGCTANTIISFSGVSAKYVKLTIDANWGGVSPSTGLSEVRFFYIPDVSATNL